MDDLDLGKAFTLIEPGPVVLITTNDGQRNNVMTITWTMVMDFSATFAVTTGPWNHSYRALVERRECVIAIPTVDMIDTAVAIGTCSGKNVDKFDRFALTPVNRSEEHTSELKSLMRISYAVFCLKKNKRHIIHI